MNISLTSTAVVTLMLFILTQWITMVGVIVKLWISDTELSGSIKNLSGILEKIDKEMTRRHDHYGDTWARYEERLDRIDKQLGLQGYQSHEKGFTR